MNDWCRFIVIFRRKQLDAMNRNRGEKNGYIKNEENAELRILNYFTDSFIQCYYLCFLFNFKNICIHLSNGDNILDKHGNVYGYDEWIKLFLI